MSKDKKERDAYINGNKYHIVIVENNRYKRVSVYGPENPTFTTQRKNDTDLVYDKRWKGSVLWLGRDKSPPIEEMVREATNKAVCIYENKVEEQEEHDRKIREALDNVAEVHESES